uniref:Putative ovule protein n=1 Tax=Solanum chacoense TaxID=4108 RepID=A0A0V0GNB8_SOLCH
MVSMLRYNIETTGFHNYAIYNLDFIYFWSKKVVKEHFLCYVNQQKEIHRSAKGERLGAVSEFKVSSQQRDRGEEARELLGSLVFGVNWKIPRVRWWIKKGRRR